METSSSQTGLEQKLPIFKNQTNMRIGLQRPTLQEWTYNHHKTVRMQSTHTFRMMMNTTNKLI
eukprot:8078055-Ditylum_brightwellii.AAC.1